ncbi:MAG: dockerin type I domain-containing protein [Caldicoprobacterales bacterium]|jgi:predicted peptidase
MTKRKTSQFLSMVLICTLLITLFVPAGYVFAQAADDSLYNFETGLHDFWHDDGEHGTGGISVSRDNTRSFAGDYSMKITLEGEDYYTLGVQSPPGSVGMTITYRFYIPSGGETLLVPYIMNYSYDWHSDWVWEPPKDEWIELKLEIPSGFNSLERLGVQIWTDIPIEIWMDSITVGFDDDPGDPGDPVEPDDSLFNFETGLHDFWVDEDGVLVRDNTRSYLGEYSVKLAMEGDVFYSIGKESPGSAIQPGMTITYHFFLPEESDPDEVVVISPYCMDRNWGNWQSNWVELHPRGQWFEVKLKIPENYNTPLARLGVQLWCENPIDIWMDSISVGFDIDKTGLQQKIEDATLLHDSAVEGTEPGQYAAGSKAILMAAITQATSVLLDESATQAVINQAITDLDNAIADFLAAKVPGDGLSITVEYDNVINDIRYPFWGINYVAFWDDIQGSPESMHAIKQTGIDYLRFPGGEPGNWYDWAQETDWTTTDTLALRDYANGVGAAIMLQTNPTTNEVNDNGDRNDPSGEHIADWVQYCIDNNVNVPFWEIGNELDIDLWDPQRLHEFAWYLDIYEEHYDAIKSVDPDAVVMGPASTNTWYWWGVGILDYFLKSFGNVYGNGKVDAVSLHYYPEGSATWDFIKSSAQDEWYRAMDFIQGVLDENDTRDLPLFITETSVAIGTWGGSGTNANMIGALGMADLLGAYRNSGVQSVALFGCIHSASRNWGLLYGVGEDRPAETPTPTYFILPIWTASGDQVLNVTGLDEDTERLSLSSYASRKDDGSVQVVIINKEAAPTNVNISIDGIDIDGASVEIYEMKPKNGSLTDKDVYYNGQLMPDVARELLPGPTEDVVEGEIYTKIVPGYSLTLLDFKTTSDPGFDPAEERVESITLITEVTPYGEKVMAAALEYDEVIDNESLDDSCYSVIGTMLYDSKDPRTVTRVYTNTSPSMTDEPVNGKYVIIELDENDDNASTLEYSFDTWLNFRPEPDYQVYQEKDINTVSGEIIKASDVAMNSTDEINLVVEDFQRLSHYNEEYDFTLNYRFFSPTTEPGEKYPLVIFLHGSGERGSDNDVQILANKGAVVWALPENQAANPAFVIAPQAPAGNNWNTARVYNSLLSLIDELASTHPIDVDRIYITGLSLGGNGTWSLIQNNPDLFAAAIPICGRGTPGNVEPIKDLPIWVFHAEDDGTVPVERSREMVDALRAIGSNVLYTEYPAGTVLPNAHFSWVPTYENQEVINWLYSQTKSALISPEFVLTYEPYITEVGEEVVVTVSVREMVDLYSFRMDIEFDQELLEFREVIFNEVFDELGFVLLHDDNKDSGSIGFLGTLLQNADGLTGDIDMARIVFAARDTAGQALTILLRGSEATDSTLNEYVTESDYEIRMAIANSDVNGDGKLSLSDLTLVAKAFDIIGDMGLYDEALDMDHDGVIDITDIAYVAKRLFMQ